VKIEIHIKASGSSHIAK